MEDASPAHWPLPELYVKTWHFIQSMLNDPHLCTSSESDILFKDFFEMVESQLLNFKCLDFGNARYGNAAFRDFFVAIEREADEKKEKYKLGEQSEYLLRSFGNPTRIDYGTGHELHFFIFLAHQPEITSQLFYSTYLNYLRLQRSIIKTFRMEPAGSKGVWGLDDYFFGPYLFGSAQLRNFDICPPRQLISKIKSYRDQGNEYLYLWALNCLVEDKGENFAEHSPLLWEISDLDSWQRIQNGLCKMYKKEVLYNPKITITFK